MHDADLISTHPSVCRGSAHIFHTEPQPPPPSCKWKHLFSCTKVRLMQKKMILYLFLPSVPIINGCVHCADIAFTGFLLVFAKAAWLCASLHPSCVNCISASKDFISFKHTKTFPSLHRQSIRHGNQWFS